MKKKTFTRRWSGKKPSLEGGVEKKPSLEGGVKLSQESVNIQNFKKKRNLTLKKKARIQLNNKKKRVLFYLPNDP
jgi:ribosomal protein S12